MKYFSRTLTCAAVLLLTCNAYAKQAVQLACPTIAMITANAKFIQAERGWEEMWGMASNDFNYHGTDWNVIFATSLPNAGTAQEALAQGQAYFQEHVNLIDPTPHTENGTTICMYSADNNQYMVAAANPPLHFSGTATNFVNHFKK